MGSFATSLHVKSDHSATVAEALRHTLLAEGYDVTDEELDREMRRGFSPTLRAVHLSQPRDGWVSLLDSNGLHSLTLAAALSDRLQTHAIQFFVNDSDSWHYQLFYAGRTLDEFNSFSDDEDFEGDEEDEASLGVVPAGNNAANLLGAFQERALQLQQQLQQRMPPEMCAMQQRWVTTGQINPEEMQQYQAWMRTQLPSLMEQVRELMGGMPGQSPRRPTRRIRLISGRTSNLCDPS